MREWSPKRAARLGPDKRGTSGMAFHFIVRSQATLAVCDFTKGASPGLPLS